MTSLTSQTWLIIFFSIISFIQLGFMYYMLKKSAHESKAQRIFFSHAIKAVNPDAKLPPTDNVVPIFPRKRVKSKVYIPSKDRDKNLGGELIDMFD